MFQVVFITCAEIMMMMMSDITEFGSERLLSASRHKSTKTCKNKNVKNITIYKRNIYVKRC